MVVTPTKGRGGCSGVIVSLTGQALLDEIDSDGDGKVRPG